MGEGVAVAVAVDVKAGVTVGDGVDVAVEVAVEDGDGVGAEATVDDGTAVAVDGGVGVAPAPASSSPPHAVKVERSRHAAQSATAQRSARLRRDSEPPPGEGRVARLAVRTFLRSARVLR